jgi:ubiquinone/menaquinone biosynthesis C-methylase UbiE
LVIGLGSLFSSQDYVLYRFEYPVNLFHRLRSCLSPSLLHEKLKVLDLGCGTGLVTESFIKSYSAPSSFDLVDPDSSMLLQAKERFAHENSISSFHCSSAENVPFEDESFDLVLIGSAWHWMNPESALKEIERILKPNGFVFIFEYQFPKAPQRSDLNDWIRIQFNTHWKPTTQTPRGSLRELTECWRKNAQFSQVSSGTLLQSRLHHASELAGVIVSQSRYQHFVQNFSEHEKVKLREELEKDLNQFLKDELAKFEYSYEGFLFKKRL